MDVLFDCITKCSEGGERTGILALLYQEWMFELRSGINERASTLESFAGQSVVLRPQCEI